MVDVILASASQRRLDLLQSIGIKPQTLIPSIDESVQPFEHPDHFIHRICLEKTKNIYKNTYKNSLIISSDTIVLLDNQIIGKPNNKKDARQILRKLSSRSHQVLTGINLRYQNNDSCSISKTNVCFDSLTDNEINLYLQREKYLDKAGAYAIQGYASLHINRIEGCYFNVMGFPLNLFYRMLKEINLKFEDLIHS